MNTNEPHASPCICIKDLKPGDSVLQYFLLKSKDMRRTRSGQDYLNLSLGDSTGTISAKMWSDAIRKWGQNFQVGDCVKIEGRVESYRDSCQIIVDKIRTADLSEVPNPEMLIRSTIFDPEELFTELKELATGLQPPELAELVCVALDQNAESFKTYPAARLVHHAYRGGLIEHVCAVTRKVNAVLPLCGNVNRNITLAGAILHDIGKIREFSSVGQARSLEGRLLGHIVLGAMLFRELAREKKIADQPWNREIEHIILSHHGETEFGAPVKPLTREALIVYFMDNLDSKLKIVDEALVSADTEGFSPYNKWLEGRAFRGSLSLPEEEYND